MKAAFFFALVILNTYQQGLDYPKNANEIKEVELLRPDPKSSGKFAQVKTLDLSETKQLLFILGYAKPVDVKNFKADYHIIFSTLQNTTKKIMVNKNKVKGHNSDQVYEIRPTSFLLEF